VLATIGDHVAPTQTVSLSRYVQLFPSLKSLGVHWFWTFAGSDQNLAPSTSVSSTTVTSLMLAFDKQH
jgi:hypothetical protein